MQSLLRPALSYVYARATYQQPSNGLEIHGWCTKNQYLKAQELAQQTLGQKQLVPEDKTCGAPSKWCKRFRHFYKHLPTEGQIARCQLQLANQSWLVRSRRYFRLLHPCWLLHIREKYCRDKGASVYAWRNRAAASFSFLSQIRKGSRCQHFRIDL